MLSEKEQNIISRARSEALGIELLAKAYYEGTNGLEKNPEKAFYYSCMSVWKGNVILASQVGYFYLNGIGTEKNPDYAFLYYLHAAKNGSAIGQYVVGNFYSDEKFAPESICPLNYYTGHLWYERAAEQGNNNAMFEMGFDYYHGRGAVFDLDKALFWFEKSAEQGNTAAMFNTALFYHGNEGILYEDANKAGYWFNQAAQKGNTEAKKALSYYKYSNFSKKWKKVE